MRFSGVLLLMVMLLVSIAKGQHVPEAEQRLDAGAEILYSLMQVAESSHLTTEVPPPMPDSQSKEESISADATSSGETELQGMAKDYFQDLSATSDAPVNSEEVDLASQELSNERDSSVETENNESAEYENLEIVTEDASTESKPGAFSHQYASIPVPFSTTPPTMQKTTKPDQFHDNDGRALPKIPKLVTASKQLPPVRAHCLLYTI